MIHEATLSPDQGEFINHEDFRVVFNKNLVGLDWNYAQCCSHRRSKAASRPVQSRRRLQPHLRGQRGVRKIGELRQVQGVIGISRGRKNPKCHKFAAVPFLRPLPV